MATNASLTATLFTTNVPSGNDDMVVDLATGAVVYEGLFATQGESNTRYNTDEYKSTKMVLRKVPRTADSATLPNGPFAGGYPTGDNTNYSSSNGARTWTTDRDYYISVFEVTQTQYRNVGSDANPNVTASLNPICKVSWNDLRRPIDMTERLAPNVAIPSVVADGTGTFFQRLNLQDGALLRPADGGDVRNRDERRHDEHLSLGRQLGSNGDICGVRPRRKCEGRLTSAERLGPLRHVRQPVRMGPGRLWSRQYELAAGRLHASL